MVDGLHAARLSDGDYRRNFSDLVEPLDPPRARIEADRCYYCWDAPCIAACPTSIDVPRFIRAIRTDDVRGAALAILEANVMGATCGRVCPTEVLCEGACVRTAAEGVPVAIGRLQRYATDRLLHSGEQPWARAPSTGRRVAIVGAGPAGLACAHALALHGHNCVVFERRVKPGGLNEHGIAAYKMVDEAAQREVAFIMGVGGIELRPSEPIDVPAQLAALRRDHDAVFLSTGLDDARRLDLMTAAPVAGLESATAFIERVRQSEHLATVPVGREVIVIGGGATAIDAAMQAKRLGASVVTIVYRRAREAMAATEHEQHLASTDGIAFRFGLQPLGVVTAAGRLRGLRFAAPAELGGELTLPADHVLAAIGQQLDPAMDWAAAGIALAAGKIVVDSERRTSLPGVWAGGDCVALGPDLTVVAVEDGKQAARSIHRSLSQEATP